MKSVLGFSYGGLLMLLGSGWAGAQSYPRLPAQVWFLRISNPSNASAKLCVRVYFNPNRTPWWGDTVYLARGGEQLEIPAVDQWLAPGESSDWIDLGPHISSSPTFGGSPNYLSSVFLGAMYEPAGEYLRLAAEVARGPEKRLVRRLEIGETRPTKLGHSTWLGSHPLPTLGLLIPVDPDRDERIWTLEEAAQQQLEWIASYGPTPKPPRHILFICHQAQVAFRNPTRLQALNTEILRRLGYNNLTQYARDAADIAAIRALGVEPGRALHISRENPAEQARKLKEQGVWEYVRLANFGDEIDIALNASPEEQDAAFVAYLKQAGFAALDFVRPEDEARAAALPEEQRWQFVHLGGPLPPQKPKLLFEAATFRYRLWTRELRASTEEIQAHFPPGTETGANFSPHLSVWPDVRKWINIFRDGGMTLPWSEDWWWQVPEASPQSYGFLLDALRHAADYHQAPFCFYTIPDSGETPEHLLRMNYFALGHQAKMIDHFAIYHQAFGTCDYIDFAESKEKFRAIHRILTDVGRIDERLYPARMRPAQVAILLSIANDVWNTEDLLSQDPPQQNLYYATLNVDNHERKALWLALRHAQFPVDLITDEDVAEGRLDRYKVLYLVGQELLERAVPALQRWVERGGTLVATGGGGLLNQYREPIPAMQALYGLEGATLERATRRLGPASDLPGAQPLDTLTFPAPPGGRPLRMPAYCYKHSLTPGRGSPVVAHYTDGSPAAVDRRVGRGRVILWGGLPGLAYLQPAMAKRQGLPEAFPGPLRRLIVAPAEAAGVARPVVTSDPLVEATLQEGPQGAVVTLISFRNRPLQSVSVRLPGLPRARRVESLRHGHLPVRRGPAGPVVRLPLDQGDLLLVD